MELISRGGDRFWYIVDSLNPAYPGTYPKRKSMGSNPSAPCSTLKKYSVWYTFFFVLLVIHIYIYLRAIFRNFNLVLGCFWILTYLHYNNKMWKMRNHRYHPIYIYIRTTLTDTKKNVQRLKMFDEQVYMTSIT